MKRLRNWRGFTVVVVATALLTVVAFTPATWAIPVLCDTPADHHVGGYPYCIAACDNELNYHCTQFFTYECVDFYNSYTHQVFTEEGHCGCTWHCEVSACWEECPW